MVNSFYALRGRTNKGEDIDFSTFKGKTVLIVNTASKCGFTPQYTGLQKLYTEWKDRGLVVLGFPCDQFAHQEPGNNEEIAEFCSINFGVTFPLMEKVYVNGSMTHPVFEYAKKKAFALFGQDIKWNFTKFLVSPDGKAIKRFAPNTEPEKLQKDIERFVRGK